MTTVVAATSKREPRTSLRAALLAHDAHALDALGLAGLGLDLLGQGAELELDALLEGGGEVAGAGRDVVGLVLGDDDDLLGALAARRAGDVEGGDAVADHGDLLRELDGAALAHALEQLEAVQGGVVAGEDVLAAPPSVPTLMTTASKPASNRPSGSTS